MACMFAAIDACIAGFNVTFGNLGHSRIINKKYKILPRNRHINVQLYICAKFAMCRVGMGRVGHVPSLLCAELTRHFLQVFTSSLVLLTFLLAMLR